MQFEASWDGVEVWVVNVAKITVHSQVGDCFLGITPRVQVLAIIVHRANENPVTRDEKICK
jgi:hypothetical protein